MSDTSITVIYHLYYVSDCTVQLYHSCKATSSAMESWPYKTGGIS